jgi:hypothetical protein
VTDNDFGIVVSSTNNFIIKNVARGNATNFSIASGNRVGPVDTGSSGTITNNNPWANFVY